MLRLFCCALFLAALAGCSSLPTEPTRPAARAAVESHSDPIDLRPGYPAAYLVIHARGGVEFNDADPIALRAELPDGRTWHGSIGCRWGEFGIGAAVSDYEGGEESGGGAIVARVYRKRVELWLTEPPFAGPIMVLVGSFSAQAPRHIKKRGLPVAECLTVAPDGCCHCDVYPCA